MRQRALGRGAGVDWNRFKKRCLKKRLGRVSAVALAHGKWKCITHHVLLIGSFLVGHEGFHLALLVRACSHSMAQPALLGKPSYHLRCSAPRIDLPLRSLLQQGESCAADC